jgi:diamine N-acetyltransferase
MFENEQIKLRAPEPGDLDFLYRRENDTSLWTWSSTIVPFSRYDLKQYILSDKDIYKSKQLRLMIELKSEKKAVGMIDLYDFDPFHKRAAVSILLDRNYQRKGIAVDALTLLCEYSLSFLKLHQIYAFISVKNEPCKRLFLRFGFKEQGVLTDWLQGTEGYEDVLIFSLMADKWFDKLAGQIIR